METKMWTDRQTDVGHINLIGGLVTRNPPKKEYKVLPFKGHLSLSMLTSSFSRK